MANRGCRMIHVKILLFLILDGVVSGTNQTASIIAQSEFEWDGDRRRGLGDYRIPKPLVSDLNGNPRNRSDFAPNLGKSSNMARLNTTIFQ